MQPHFLPWLGYIELLKSCDVFVLLDDFQLSRQSWSTRNRLFVSQDKTGWISLNLDHSIPLGATFCEARESADRIWIRRLRNIIQDVYRRAPFAAEARDTVLEWTSRDHESVADLALDLLLILKRNLHLPTEVVQSSSLMIKATDRSDRLLRLLDGVGADCYLAARGAAEYMLKDDVWSDRNILFQNHNPLEYRQVTGTEFVPRLAFLDALANVGWDNLNHLCEGTRRWLTLEQVGTL
jgi:hypothetical protein